MQRDNMTGTAENTTLLSPSFPEIIKGPWTPAARQQALNQQRKTTISRILVER
jgi:hypothetical protein